MTARPIVIAPSILTADFGWLADEIASAEAGGAGRFHLDVMDGHFVPQLSFGPSVVEAVARATTLPLEVHLMVANPLAHLASFADAGAEMLIPHYEAAPDVAALIEDVRDLGCRPALAINPATSWTVLEPWLAQLDGVTVMLVEPGRGGQPMLVEHLDKVRHLRAAVDRAGLDVRLEVDGGVKEHNAAGCVAAGADVLVAGSAVYDGVRVPADALRSLLATLSAEAERT